MRSSPRKAATKPPCSCARTAVWCTSRSKAGSPSSRPSPPPSPPVWPLGDYVQYLAVWRVTVEVKAGSDSAWERIKKVAAPDKPRTLRARLLAGPHGGAPAGREPHPEAAPSASSQPGSKAANSEHPHPGRTPTTPPSRTFSLGPDFGAISPVLVRQKGRSRAGPLRLSGRGVVTTSTSCTRSTTSSQAIGEDLVFLPAVWDPRQSTNPTGDCCCASSMIWSRRVEPIVTGRLERRKGEDHGGIDDRIEESKNWFERMMEHVPGYSGYKEKEIAREADKIERVYVAERLEPCLGQLDDLKLDLLKAGKLDALGDVDVLHAQAAQGARPGAVRRLRLRRPVRPTKVGSQTIDELYGLRQSSRDRGRRHHATWPAPWPPTVPRFAPISSCSTIASTLSTRASPSAIISSPEPGGKRWPSWT